MIHKNNNNKNNNNNNNNNQGVFLELLVAANKCKPPLATPRGKLQLATR